MLKKVTGSPSDFVRAGSDKSKSVFIHNMGNLHHGQGHDSFPRYIFYIKQDFCHFLLLYMDLSIII